MKLTVNIKHIRNTYRNVNEYKRKTGSVGAYYTGLGPNKPVPNKPRAELFEWLRNHGATEEQLAPIYWVAFQESVKTHDLINRDLLDVDNYLAALNA